MSEEDKWSIELPFEITFWLVFGFVVLCIAAWLFGYNDGMESRCETDCGGKMFEYTRSGECICEDPDGGLYRAPGWEAPE